jgi:NADPH:quinone reductase-like Zn-dependent oxidoreductase
MLTEQAAGPQTMHSLRHDRYGPPEVAELREVDKPAVEDDSVLVSVRAASVNPADWYALTGWIVAGRLMTGSLRRPKEHALGTDFAGVVEEVGGGVTDFRPGDEVFGGPRASSSSRSRAVFDSEAKTR